MEGRTRPVEIREYVPLFSIDVAPMTLEALRDHFPHTEHQTYLNHAAMSPLSRPVRAAVDAYVAERHGTDDPAHAGGIVTVVPDEPEPLFDPLKERGVTGALRNRKLRFAPTYYNDESDLRAVLDAIDAVQR